MLQDGSGEVARLLAGVRMHDGPIGPGTLFAAVAPLESLAIVEPTVGAGGRPAYRLTQLGQAPPVRSSRSEPSSSIQSALPPPRNSPIRTWIGPMRAELVPHTGFPVIRLMRLSRVHVVPPRDA